MPTLLSDGSHIPVDDGETVLEALLRAGHHVASSCRAGACQSCLVRATAGAIPDGAQRGLRESLRQQGYFLSCQAKPKEDLAISLASAEELSVGARVVDVSPLGADVVRVRLAPERSFAYRAGQFITLLRDDGLGRSYSLASSPTEPSGELELHVRVTPGGLMSQWLASPAAHGASVKVRGPAGDCFYLEGRTEEELVLVGAGTGLAPLWGILHDALAAGHRGGITLWHGARTERGLYLRNELETLASRHPHLSYEACVLEGPASPAVRVGKLDEVLLATTPSFKGRRVYLCGDPGLVTQLKRKVFLRGAASSAIHADPFLPSAPA